MSTPVETVWPVGVVVAVWLIVVARLRGDLKVTGPMAVVGMVAIGVRCLWIPAWTGHTFDGHEAEYWDLFRGMRLPTRGGTVMVPAMQWFWWGLGQVLPTSERLVVSLMTAFGVGSVALAAGAVGRLTDRKAGWMTAALLVLHAGHSAWSSSAYNVIIPHFFSSMALFGVASAARGQKGPWRSLVVLSIALSMAFRLDSGSIAIAVVLVALLVRPDGASFLDRVRRWVGPGVACIVVTGACIWPMLWPGELPGSGERALAWSLNQQFFAPYHPFDHPVMAAGLAMSVVLAVRRSPGVAFSLVVWAVLHHGLMASFDDFGERHALVIAPALAGLVGVGMASLKHYGVPIVAGMSALSAVDVHDTATRYYGSEDRFIEVLSREPYRDLPRVQWSGSPPADCGWVAEDQRVASRPVASHFNLLRPEEEAALRGSTGCIKWCADVQDWRWSSRGVRDRALRLQHLFNLTPSAVVVDSSTGYACLTMDVGHRKRSGTRPIDETNGRTSRSDIGVP